MQGYKKVVIWGGALLLALGLTACGDKEAQVIKVGATVGPHAQVVEAVAKEAAKQGLKVEVVKFNDYVTPDASLADGSIDIASYQHLPFLKNYNSAHGTDMVSIGRSILLRMGIYSHKYKSIADIPDGARIAVPSDPTNEGRGFLLLQKAGLIKLKPNVGFTATPQDVLENPKNFSFIEVDAAQLPRTLDDVDAAVITMNYVMSSGMDPNKESIFMESKDAPLAVMIIAARKKDKDNPAYKKFVKIYQSQATRDFLDKTFKGTVQAAF